MAHGPDLTPGAQRDLGPGHQRGAEGFFHLVRYPAGQWQLVGPDGRPFYLKAVRDVRADAAESDTAPRAAPVTRLRAWGFNAVSVGGDGAGRDDGWPYFASADFLRHSPVIAAPGVRLPDVFAPEWSARIHALALETCAPLLSTHELIGWLADDRLSWGFGGSDARPGLLQVCLSLEPTYAAYHAAWEFVLALHAGSVAAVARAWETPLANKESLRELTRGEIAIATRGYARDDARWTREFAGRYFASTAEAIRAADPNHLFCGCGFSGRLGAPVVAAATCPAVDVTLLPWLELPAPGALAGPVIAADVGWSEPSFWAPPEAGVRNGPRLTSIERRLRRARTALRRLARHPAVVGFVWAQWRDEPGEQPPFARGLVHLDGREAPENSELIAEFNARAEGLRRAAAKTLSP